MDSRQNLVPDRRLWASVCALSGLCARGSMFSRQNFVLENDPWALPGRPCAQHTIGERQRFVLFELFDVYHNVLNVHVASSKRQYSDSNRDSIRPTYSQ